MKDEHELRAKAMELAVHAHMTIDGPQCSLNETADKMLAYITKADREREYPNRCPDPAHDHIPMEDGDEPPGLWARDCKGI